ncbi:hypothetical protein CDD82_6851 [Ophiocordyceps australis]|uniref:PhoD-like phosphatase metallophosphatase domain-containing protein n=1 Tax=Ophiocordyceps australis TaxID=1399860 RepID=A0A2C5YTS4_9HYPO|nr:hypothetical protein CDD82_6851 [Ophiocordyceps australis]
MPIQTLVAKVSSTTLRLSSLIFFRIAHFPSVIFSLFVIYLPAFVASYLTRPELEVVDDQLDVSVQDTVVHERSPSPGEDGAHLVAEEIQVQEKITLQERAPGPWSVLVLGAPSSRRPFLSIFTLFLNLLLVGFTADALYRARWYFPSHDLSFVRLGFVSHSEARFLIREPNQAKMPVVLEIRLKDAEPPLDNSLWKTAGGIRWTSNETDFTASIPAPLSHMEQRWYEWRTSNNHSGAFLAPPKPGSQSRLNNGKFTFLSTSCILPRFPYNPLDHALAIPGLRHLAHKIPELGAQFMLFLGDFIYVDVPQRFGVSSEEYRMQYRQVYASPDWAPVGQNLSWLHVLDDHEISNDWSSNTTGIYNTAVEPWHIYQANVNPPRATKAGTSSLRGQEATWFEFVQGPASFFLLDTRSYRSSNSIPFNDSSKTMLGEEQLADFLAWLARPEPKGVKWKFVASSVPFTKNWPVNVKDTWGGFLVERSKILEAMWDAGARGTTVVVLSGDRHEFAATKFPPPRDSQWPDTATAFEFSTSPLNQFACPFPSYKQTDNEDVMLRYIPGGRSKFGSFTIDNAAGESTLEYRLYINGKETWRTVLVEPPVSQYSRPDMSFWDRMKSLQHVL